MAKQEDGKGGAGGLEDPIAVAGAPVLLHDVPEARDPSSSRDA